MMAGVPAASAGRARQIRAAVMAACVLVLSLSLAVRGTQWAQRWHPDEIICSQYLHFVLSDGYLHSTYPSGAFQLMRAAAFVTDGTVAVFRRLGRYVGQEKRHQRDPAALQVPEYDRIPHSITFGRVCNAVFAALAAAFLYLAVLHATGSPLAALFGALLLGGNAVFVEHAHYFETDMACILMLSVFLSVSLLALRKQSTPLFLAAAALSGFAFATKYTLAPAVAVSWLSLAAHLVCKSRQASPSKTVLFRRVCGFSALFAVLVFAGIALAMPVVLKRAGYFFTNILGIFSTVYSETGGIIARHVAQAPAETAAVTANAAGSPAPAGAARPLFILHEMRLFLLPPASWLSWAIIASGTLVSFSKIGLRIDRALRAAQLFLLILLGFFLLLPPAIYPWFRSQEALPHHAVAAALCAVSLVVLWKAVPACRSLARQKIIRSVASVCAAAVLGIPLCGGLRTSDAFAMADVRSECRDWLHESAPTGARFGTEKYANQIFHRNKRFQHMAASTKAETIGAAPGTGSLTNFCDFVLRTPAIAGRGVMDFRTGRRYPALEKGWCRFTNNAVLLKSWKITGRPRPTFCQQDIELWQLTGPGGRSVAERKEPGYRPHSLYYPGRETYFVTDGGTALGAHQSIALNSTWSAVRIPCEKEEKAWAVTHYVRGKGSVTVCWKSLFLPGTAILQPGGSAVAVLSGGAWLRTVIECVPSTAVKILGGDADTVCITTVTKDPAYAAELLRRSGAADEALSLLSSPEALRAPLALHDGGGALPPGTARAFSSLRLNNLALFNYGRSDATRYRVTSKVPVLFEPGSYRMTLTIPESSGAREIQELRLDGRGVEMDPVSLSIPAGAPAMVDCSFVIAEPVQASLSANQSGPLGYHTLMLRDIAFTWE